MKVAIQRATAFGVIVLLGAWTSVGVQASQDAAGDRQGAAEGARLWGDLDGAIVQRLFEGEKVPLSDAGVTPEAAAPYTRIRPGSPQMNPGWPLSVFPFLCTLNFVFAQGDRLAIGAAGHCHDPVHGGGGVGERVSTLVVDADHQTFGVVEFGTVIVQENSYEGGIEADFALIEVDPEDKHLVHPAIAEIDGPCGWRDAVPDEMVQFYGHNPYPWGPGGQPRTGPVTTATASTVNFLPLPGIAGGDSGSPLRFLGEPDDLDLAAAGVVVGGQIMVFVPVFPIFEGRAVSMPTVFAVIAGGDVGEWSLVDSPNCGFLTGSAESVQPGLVRTNKEK